MRGHLPQLAGNRAADLAHRSLKRRAVHKPAGLVVRAGIDALPHHHLYPGSDAEQGDVVRPDVGMVTE